MENMKSLASGGEENTKLLFFEHFISPKLQYNIEEIFFSKAILLQQIRILKADSNPHAKIKSMQSKTQREQIFNFDIFARNLKSYSDKFEYLFESDTVNKENGESDSIFPIMTEFVTNHIVIRGKFERITMCIYGIPFSGAENHQLLETAKSDVPLDRISKSQTESKDEKLSLTNEDMTMIQLYPIETLVSSYINCDISETIIQRAYFVNKPNLNMIDKTKSGYIYYENDLIYYTQSLYNFYLNQNKNKKNLSIQTFDEQWIKSEIEQQEHFQKVFDIIKILINKNIAYLDQDCVFRKENLEIYYKIPEALVSICVMALSGNAFGYTEIKFGLKLLKLICNSAGLVAKFIEEDGMETLYNILFIRERNEKGNDGIDGFNGDYSNILKILVLENIYRLITYKVAFERFMQNIDKKKFPQQYFLIKELAKESLGNQSSETSVNNYETLKSDNIMNVMKEEKESGKRKDKDKREKEKDKDRNRDRDKEKDKDKDKDRKHKKKYKSSKRDKSSSKSKHSRSRSRSRSLSIPKSKDKRKSSKDSSSSQDSKSKKIKKKHKNIPLKNGYQIILTLIIGKKNNLISNVIKKIINKVSLLLYLQKFGEQVQNINNQTSIIINVDLVKLSNQLKKIFEYINKSEVTYRKGYPNDNQSFLNKDYPYTNFWIDYLKTNRKNFKKAELNNIKSTLENEIHSTNKFNDAGIITNELAVIFEESAFIHNVILLLANQQVQSSVQYFDIAITAKNVLAYILLSRGGINFFSKNFDITMQLIALFDAMIDDNMTTIPEDNLFQISLPSSAIILTNKSYFEHHKYSKLNEVLINISDNAQFTDEYIIKLHFLQLKILFCYSFMFLGKVDTLLSAKEENESFIDKSLDILIKISQNITKSNLSRQAFLSFAQNEFFFNEILLLLSSYTNNDRIEHEAHITLIIQILFFVFSEMSKTSDILLLIYGVPCLDILCTLKNSLQSQYDMRDLEPINRNFYNIIDGFISFLLPVKKFSDSKDMTLIMARVNDACFSNIQKYNLNDQVNKEEKRKEYFEEYKLNVKNHQNSDVDFLNLLESKGTLINDIFASIRINPLLLIDCVSDHIHLTLRYLIVNTVHSIKHYLKPDGKEYESNAHNQDVVKYEKLKQYSILLYHTYDILNLLLKNLLSSHVDNYRDTLVIEKTVTLLITLINFLYDVYSGNASTKQNEISITEYIQKLFGCVLETFAQICRFNATIILNFKKVLEKIAEKPSNKLGLIYLLNFMLTVSNNIYTIEIFVDHLTKIQKKPVVDIFNEIESINKITPIKIGHFAEEKTVLSYIIDIGINSNDDWIVYNCSRLLLTIYRRYIGKNRLAIYQEITEEILKQINTLFNKISKVYFLSLHDKEIIGQVPDLESLVRVLKFLIPFLKSEYKFFFLFHDVSIIYMNIFSFFKEYILHNISNDISQAQSDSLTANEKKIKNVIYDILFLVLEGMLIQCDNKRNKDKFNYEIDLHYDLSEDIPNKNQLGKVVKELDSFITIFTDQVDIKTVDANNVFATKMIIMTNKAVDIFINIASNFYGQNIILYEEFVTSNITTLPNNGKPMININSLIKKLTLIKDFKVTNDKIYSLLESIAMLVVILFYDLNYYENESLHNKKNDNSNVKLLVLTETRLCSLLKLLLPLGTQLASPIASNLPSISTTIYDLIELFHYYTAENSEIILFELNKLGSLIDNSTQNIDILQLDIKASKLPNSRDINDICDYLSKYSEYYLTQSYGMNFPLQINSKGEYAIQSQLQPNQNQLFTVPEYKQQINEFEKLLNWKKQRIFLSKIDYLNVRNSNIDLDMCLNSKVNSCLINEYDFFQLYKKYYYYNTDPFEQYCNALFNEELIINSFIQISYSISSTRMNKLYLLGYEEEYCKSHEELFFFNLECCKLDIESAKNDKDVNMNLPISQIMHKIKKKINSKLNQFIYKSKYEKYILKPPSQLATNKEQARYWSKVSGRNLSTHVDNVVPGQKVVNLTYGGANNNNNNTTSISSSQMTGGVNSIGGHEEQKDGRQGNDDNMNNTILNKQNSNSNMHEVMNKSIMNQEQSNIMAQEHQLPIPMPNLPQPHSQTQTQILSQQMHPPQPQPQSHPQPQPQFSGQMMKINQGFPYQGMPYGHQFVPGQNPNPMMINQFQGFQPIRLPGSMYSGMPNYPNPGFNQPMMPMNMINPMPNLISSVQPPLMNPNSIMPPDIHNKHNVPPQSQSMPIHQQSSSSSNQTSQKNLVDNLGTILMQIKQNMTTSNEGSKDPRIRKKK